MTLPPFIIESSTLHSHDAVQSEVNNTMTVEFATADCKAYFPIIKRADGFALEPEDLATLAEFLSGICKHNNEQEAKRI